MRGDGIRIGPIYSLSVTGNTLFVPLSWTKKVLSYKMSEK